MNIAVCVKQIPDPAVPGSLDGDHTLNRAGKLILDDSDAYGVEMSLQLAEKAGGGEVVLISMALPNTSMRRTVPPVVRRVDGERGGRGRTNGPGT